MPSQATIVLSSGFIEVLVPGLVIERSTREGEAHAAHDTLYKQLGSRAWLSFCFVVEACLNIRPAKTTMPTRGATRWQLISVRPEPYCCRMHSKHISSLAQA